MKIESDKTLAVSYQQLKKFEEALEDASKIKASVLLHPLAHQAQIDGMKSMIESIKEDINTYELDQAIQRYYEHETGQWGLKAFKMGWEAARANQPPSACPYLGKKQKSGYPTFSVAYQNRWLAGYNSYLHSRPGRKTRGALAKSSEA